MSFSLAGFGLNNDLQISGMWGIDDFGTLAINGHAIVSGNGVWFNNPPGFSLSYAANPTWFNAGANSVTITMTASDNLEDGVRFQGIVTGDAAAGAWNVDANGNWSSTGNWSPNIPTGVGIQAIFGAVIAAPRTVTLDVPVTVGSLAFNNANKYTISGSQALTLQTISGNAAINVNNGTHEIATPIALASNLDATVTNATDTLTLSGPISGSDMGLNKYGAGMLLLTGSNTYTGGTTISAGTLQVGNGGTTGTLPAGITNNSVLAFDRSDAITLSGMIGGSGSLAQAGPGTLNLTGTVCNSTIVGNAGQLVLTPSLVFSGDIVTGPGGRIQNNSSLQFGNLNNSGIFLGGGSLLGNFVNQPTGSVRLTAGQSLFLQSASPQSNSGLIQAIGTQSAQASFEAAGPFTNNPGGSALIGGQNATLNFDSGLTNQGAVAFSNGVNNVSGTVANSPGGNITVTGGASVTFWGDVAQNGTMVVSKVGNIESSAVFLGAFTGSGGFTGGGDVFFAGDLRPGNSPAEVTFGGNAYLGNSTNTVMELAGTTAGSQYDKLDVTGQLVLAGDLDVVLLDSFQPLAGQSFDLFDGSMSGTFSRVTLPALDNGLQWDTSNLYANGTISVTPEPSTLALLVAAVVIGFAGLAWRRRVARTSKPVAFDQHDAPAILSFPAHPSKASAARRAA